MREGKRDWTERGRDKQTDGEVDRQTEERPKYFILFYHVFISFNKMLDYSTSLRMQRHRWSG